MTVRLIELADGNTHAVSGAGYDPTQGEIEGNMDNPLLQKLIIIAWKSNESSLRKTESGYAMLGDPTE